jgi:hypothetical protein
MPHVLLLCALLRHHPRHVRLFHVRLFHVRLLRVQLRHVQIPLPLLPWTICLLTCTRAYAGRSRI